MSNSPGEEPIASRQVPSTKRRRRLAISLRSMMVLILVVAVWTAWQVNHARQVRRAIATIKKSGGHVFLEEPFNASGEWKSWPHPPRWLYLKLGEEYFSKANRVSIVKMQGEQCEPEVIEAIVTLPGLKSLQLFNICLSDADLKTITRQSELEEIEIGEPFDLLMPAPLRKESKANLGKKLPELTTAGLRQLAHLKKLQKIDLNIRCAVDVPTLEEWSRLPNLRELELSNDKLQDAELQALGKFSGLQKLEFAGEVQIFALRKSRPLPIAAWRELRSLRITHIQLSADEVQALSHLPKLESLTLSLARISDDHLLLMRNMKGLKEFSLQGGPVTRAGIKVLQEALPNLTIESN